MELNRVNDKTGLKKIARDLWDILVDTYTDTIVLHQQQQQQQQQQQKRPSTSPPNQKPAPLLQLPGQPTTSTATSAPTAPSAQQKQQPSPVNMISPPQLTQQQSAARDLHLLQTNRQFIAGLFTGINNRQIRNIVVSMLTSMYNTMDASANAEIKSELRYLWPTSTSQTSFNLPSFHDLLFKYLDHTLSVYSPFNASWNRVAGDVSVARSLSSDAIKFYLKFFLLETRHFFRNKQLIEVNNTSVRFDEKILKFLIKACAALNKHTHAAALCQLLLNNNEYTAAFRYLQESSVLVPTADHMDEVYECVWDMELLEYLANLNTIRGYVGRKSEVLKLVGMQSANVSNPGEIVARTVECKKVMLFQKLVNYYFL
jgi:hypothetical protein